MAPAGDISAIVADESKHVQAGDRSRYVEPPKPANDSNPAVGNGNSFSSIGDAWKCRYKDKNGGDPRFIFS